MRMRGLNFMVLVLAAACGGDKNDSDSDGSTGGGASEGTQGMSSTPTTGESAGEGTTADAGTGDATSNGEATGMGPTSADPSDPSDPTAGTTADPTDPTAGSELCDQLCAKAVECEVDLGGPQCVNGCNGGYTGEPTCDMAFDQAYACLIGLDCAALAAAINEEDFGACADEIMAQETACAGQTCEASIGINEDSTECSYSQDCPDGVSEMQCDATTCTCTIDGMPAGECASDGACTAIEGISAKAQTCCGFD